jgi:hypothetical protein
MVAVSASPTSGQPPRTFSAAQLAEYLDCRDLAGNPAARVILQWANDGSIPPPDIRRGGDAFWRRETIIEFVNRLSNPAPEPLLVDGNGLARMLGVSPRWVNARRTEIIGAQKVGGRWRYNVEVIRRLIASGKDVVAAPPAVSPPSLKTPKPKN